MTSAIDTIVAAYFKLGNRSALEDLVGYRERLAGNMRGPAGYDFSIALDQLDREIAAVKNGLQQLETPPADNRGISEGCEEI